MGSVKHFTCSEKYLIFLLRVGHFDFVKMTVFEIPERSERDTRNYEIIFEYLIVVGFF